MKRTFSRGQKGPSPLGKNSGDDVYDIGFTLETKHSFDDIWGALAKPEKIAHWMRPVSGKLAKGGEYTIGDLASGTVLICEPKRRLALTMQRLSAQQRIEVAFSEVGKGKAKTRNLTVKVTAKMSDLPPGAWQKSGPALVAIGWELLAKSLFAYLDDPTNPPTAGAFANYAASADGRDYLNAAFMAWRHAALAGGESGDIMDAAPISLLGLYSGLHP